jgi:hypothetical protein
MWLVEPRTRREQPVTNPAIIALACFAAGAGVMYLLDRAGPRACGTAQAAWASARRRRVTDRILLGRVCSAVGSAVSSPSVVRASVNDGIVTLRGEAALHEVDGLLRAVYAVRGVRDITNRLHERPEPAAITESAVGTGSRIRTGLAGMP